jgi:hypothetical protein
VRRILALLVAGLLAASVAAPAAMAAPPWANLVQVQPPNGTDDTLVLQKALDKCVKQGPGCTVQLQAGKYTTSQLVEYNFRGTFRGAGQTLTTIEALPNLTVNSGDAVADGECLPNLTDCLWPSLIIFVDGNIAVSDLAISEPWTPANATTGATTPWTISGSGPFTVLVDALRFMGQRRTDVSVDRISIQGATDSSATSFSGYNLINGVLYAGELPRSSTPFDYYTLSGSLSVRNSSFSTMYDGGFADGFLTSVNATIGGSPSTGNGFDNVCEGIDLESAQNSMFDVSYNTVSATCFAGADVAVYPWGGPFVPSRPSQYRIHDNTLVTPPDAPYLMGVFLWNDPANPWIQAQIWNNTF